MSIGPIENEEKENNLEKLTIPFVPKKMRGKVYWDQDAPPDPPYPRVISKKELAILKKQARPGETYSLKGINYIDIRVMMIDAKLIAFTQELLGEGGMAQVFIAQDLETGEWLADKKILRGDYKKELENTKKMNQFSGQLRPTKELIIKFFPGHDLAPSANGRKSRFREEPPLTPGECLQIIKTGLESLQHIHQAGCVHADIKPANMMYNPITGEVSLIDLGFMTPIGSEYPGCTRRYCSPERKRARHIGFKQTTASDIYSFGFAMQEIFGFRDTTDLFDLINFSDQIIKDESIRKEIFDLLVSLTKENPDDRLTLDQALEKINDLSQVSLNIPIPKQNLSLDLNFFKNLTNEEKKEHLDKIKAREFDRVSLHSDSEKIDFELCFNMLVFLKEDYGLPSVSQEVTHAVNQDLSKKILKDRIQSLDQKSDMDMIFIADKEGDPYLVEDENLEKKRLMVFIGSLQEEKERLKNGAIKLLDGKICSWMCNSIRRDMAKHLYSIILLLDEEIQKSNIKINQYDFEVNYKEIITHLVNPSWKLNVIRALSNTQSILEVPSGNISKKKSIKK